MTSRRDRDGDLEYCALVHDDDLEVPAPLVDDDDLEVPAPSSTTMSQRPRPRQPLLQTREAPLLARANTGRRWDVRTWFTASVHTRRTLEHYHPDEGPLDQWLARWAEQGLSPEYPWPSTAIVVNGRLVYPYALIDSAWLAEHPGWMTEALP
jgi:hypothetical protein